MDRSPNGCRVRVGALGCPGLNVDEWRAANAVRLHPGMVNRWLIARELDSNPNETVIKNQLVAFFAKSFEREISDYASQVLGFSNVGPCDNIQLVKASRDPINFPSTQRREQLPQGPLPLLKATNVLYMDVTFNYRGSLEWTAWPTAKLGPVAKVGPSGYEFCPVDADCILLAAADPVSLAPPKRSAGTMAQQVTQSAVKTTLVYAAATFAGLGLIIYATRKTGLA